MSTKNYMLKATDRKYTLVVDTNGYMLKLTMLTIARLELRVTSTVYNYV